MTASARVRAARELHGFLVNEGSGRGGVDQAARAGVAAETLDRLSSVMAFDCASLKDWDTAAGRHRALANHGYPEYVTRWGNHRVHLTGRFQSITVGQPVSRSAEGWPHDDEGYDVVMGPCGFHDGLTLRLRAQDGRTVGALFANTVAASRVDDLAVDLLGLLTPSLTALLDRLPRLRPLSDDLTEGLAEGMVVTRSGRVQALTSGAATDLFQPGGVLWPLVGRVRHGTGRSVAATVLVGSRVLTVSVEAGEHGALVVHRTIPPPLGLSIRELEILDGLARGATNTAMAARFTLTPRTVATYVERLLTKTGCPNRTAASHLAGRLNLVVARDLTHS